MGGRGTGLRFGAEETGEGRMSSSLKAVAEAERGEVEGEVGEMEEVSLRAP